MMMVVVVAGAMAMARASSVPLTGHGTGVEVTWQRLDLKIDRSTVERVSPEAIHEAE